MKLNRVANTLKTVQLGAIDGKGLLDDEINFWLDSNPSVVVLSVDFTTVVYEGSILNQAFIAYGESHDF